MLFFGARVGIGHLDLMNLLLWREWAIVREVDGEVEEIFLRAGGQHVFDGADQSFRLQVAARRGATAARN